jgi:DNA-directed RNA polymerase
MSEVIRDSFIHLHSNDIIGKLREEFIDRYKDHYIPLNRAKELSKKAAERAEALAELKREKTDEEVAAAEADPEAALEAEEEDLKPGEEGVNASEVDGAPTIKINGREFVRFLDCIPPTPPRGEFDVQKIRQSKYFFS